ncbi:hypothetical protein [Paenibacillus agricola]|uniref:Uncharacterized protein n=1 Tax=Paenibacillus agricola TaxID=2716264 RepID=A0ABX0JD05_9BACL|nr:hypothetical protein [Paenibacillus agricola]NHN34372.1 hypothetical protein [Paenibacillus agricola]
MGNNKRLMNQDDKKVLSMPQSTLKAIRDLLYQGKGSIIPQYRNGFAFDSLMAARFTDTHEGAPDVLDVVAFKDSEEKRYLIEMHLGSKEISIDVERRIMDENTYLVMAIKGTFDSSKLEFLTWVDRLENPLVVQPIYDRHMLAEPVLLHSERKSVIFQRCIRR